MYSQQVNARQSSDFLSETLIIKFNDNTTLDVNFPNLKELTDSLLIFLNANDNRSINFYQALWQLKLYFEQYATTEKDKFFLKVTVNNSKYQLIKNLLTVFKKLYKEFAPEAFIQDIDGLLSEKIFNPIKKLIVIEFLLKNNRTLEAKNLILQFRHNEAELEYLNIAYKLELPLFRTARRKEVHPMMPSYKVRDTNTNSALKKRIVTKNFIKDDLNVLLQDLTSSAQKGNLAAILDYVFLHTGLIRNNNDILSKLYIAADPHLMYLKWTLKSLLIPQLEIKLEATIEASIKALFNHSDVMLKIPLRSLFHLVEELLETFGKLQEKQSINDEEKKEFLLRLWDLKLYFEQYNLSDFDKKFYEQVRKNKRYQHLKDLIIAIKKLYTKRDDASFHSKIKTYVNLPPSLAFVKQSLILEAQLQHDSNSLEARCLLQQHASTDPEAEYIALKYGIIGISNKSFIEHPMCSIHRFYKELALEFTGTVNSSSIIRYLRFAKFAIRGNLLALYAYLYFNYQAIANPKTIASMIKNNLNKEEKNFIYFDRKLSKKLEVMTNIHYARLEGIVSPPQSTHSSPKTRRKAGTPMVNF